MELSKNLANRRLSASDYYNLSSLVGNTPEEFDKIKELHTQIGNLLVSCFDRFVDDSSFLETFQKFPKSFMSTTRAALDLADLEIVSKTDNYYSEDKGKTIINRRYCIELPSPYPIDDYSFEIDSSYLKKIPEDKLELLKVWISESIHIEWVGYNRKIILKEEYFNGNIKTFGALYRMNKDWYELIVDSYYKEESEYSKEEKSKEDAKCVDEFVKSLNDLKPILDL